MGFYSDTEKGEDGKLHLAIEKWQNREREVLREICKKHGINIVAGKGSKEHLDREHYIIKKQHGENEIREQEIHSEHQQLMAMVNEQAGVVLSAQEDVNKQLEQIQDFLQNTEQGKQYAMYAKIDEINCKANQYDIPYIHLQINKGTGQNHNLQIHLHILQPHKNILGEPRRITSGRIP